MNIRVVHYAITPSPFVQAFVDVVINNTVRVNGLNLLRDGTLKSAQLTHWRRDQKRMYRDAVQILDADLEKRLTADILAAIHQHIALLSPELRIRPPAPPRTPREENVPATPKVPPAAAASPQPPPQPKPAPAALEPLPPPARLLARPRPLGAAK